MVRDKMPGTSIQADIRMSGSVYTEVGGHLNLVIPLML